jgi:hypothetical protein
VRLILLPTQAGATGLLKLDGVANAIYELSSEHIHGHT